MPDKLPAEILGTFALDRTVQESGLGGQLLLDAYHRVPTASENVVTRYLVTDAIDEDAAPFCDHYGFIHPPEVPATRLIRKISDI